MTATRATKTDNHDPAAKLALRRHFLRRYHSDAPPRVMDCCQGGGKIWAALRAEFPVASYWGLDQKTKSGRLRIDSERVLAQPGWTEDVIDVDTYGLPWKHWLALLPNVTKPTTVFLTLGNVAGLRGCTAAGAELDALGLRFPTLRLPGAFTVKFVRRMAVDYLLYQCSRFRIMMVEAAEAASTGNARYLGVRLEKAGGGRVITPPAALNTGTRQEAPHV